MAHNEHASSKTDVIMAPFLALANDYEDQAKRETAVLKRLQDREAPDWQIEGSLSHQLLYSQFAEKIRNCARQVIQEGY